MNRASPKWECEGFWVYLVGLSIFVLASGKNISLALYSMSLILAVTSLVLRSTLYRKLSAIALLLASAAIFSYVDVDLRRGPSFGIKWMPVVYYLGSAERVRQEEAKGKKVNEDFIVTRVPAFVVDVRYSLVLTLPLEEPALH